jgi:hypothetical protein
MMTDPYSVVPATRPVSPPPAAETQPIPPQPSGQIGGRAMLAPGESLTDHLTKLEQQNAPGGRRRAPEPAAPGFPTSTMPAHQVPQPTGPTSVIPPQSAWQPGGARPGTVVTSPAAKRRMALQNATQTVRDTTGRAVETFRGWPRNKQLAVAGGGVAALLAIILIFSLPGGGDKPATQTPVADPPASTPVTASGADTQAYKGNKAISVNVPARWKRTASGNYVDYIDPDDALRKVRVLAEPGKATPARFVTEVAPNGLKKSKNCPKPFKTLATDEDVQVGGHPGAELEYTCGDGDEMRHGIWRMTQVDGTMYSFFLTTPAAEFDDSKKYFAAMAESFQLNL